ncbi:MAG: DNA-binding protein [Pseudomonadota bacterium]
MTLQNLLKIQSLVEIKAPREDVQRLLLAAARNLQDAAVTSISDENRFDATYKCVMQCAIASLLVHGYRPSKSKTGHHQTAIQTLPLTVGLDAKTVEVLDGLRKQRNINDDDGDPIRPTAVEECTKQAQALLAQHHPEMR